ncbi:MAG TPA: hypothetical protein VED17_07820, partial [Nitrososphaerales archaeon]|nr:hypothetical protein [Nitrososphaerales archaeon]
TKKRVIYASNKKGSDGSDKLAVRIVTLSPSTYSWHLDYAAEEDLEQGDYKLKKLGKDKTRLDMVFKNTWKNGWGPPEMSLKPRLNLPGTRLPPLSNEILP